MYGVGVSVCSSQWQEALGDSALFPTVRALQDHIAEGGSEVLVEECEDDRSEDLGISSMAPWLCCLRQGSLWEFWFPHLQNGNKNESYFAGLLSGLNGMGIYFC